MTTVDSHNTTYLKKRRKEIVAKIFILRDLRATIGWKDYPLDGIERVFNLQFFDVPIAELQGELRLIDGPKHENFK